MNKKQSILIVDDELSVRESLRMILKPTYDIYMAADGRKALEYIKNVEIDLVTLDLRMPGLSGIETLSEIKKLNQNIPVVVITGYGTLQNAQEAIKYGIKDFIYKPLNVPEFLFIINKLLELQKDALMINKIMQEINSLPFYKA